MVWWLLIVLFMYYTCPSLALFSILFLGCIVACCCGLCFVWGVGFCVLGLQFIVFVAYCLLVVLLVWLWV